MSKFCLLSLLTALSATVAAAPDGYSINSDSPSGDADSLYRIDLATGAHTRLGRIQSLGQTRLDVEGLAFAPDGTLYGADDEAMRLFPLNVDNGIVVNQEEVNITGIPGGGGNDFGMTFACNGNLYLTSVATQSLFVVGLDGQASQVGAAGALGANISAIAAFGTPVKLYGLGNGLTSGGAVDSRKLYEINVADGTTVEVGTLSGAAGDYHEAGLAFDNSGQLWAITDRRAVPGGPFPSQILRLGLNPFSTTAVANTTEQGFESLAITVPRGCSTGGGETARFTVQKRYVDGNDVTPVTLNLSCNTGLPLEQSIEVVPNDGVFGEFEVEFVVTDFDSGELECSVTETPPAGYSPTYTCLGESTCAAPQSAQSCMFTDIESGSENLCQVQNYPDPVEFTVIKEWLFAAEELGSVNVSSIELTCENVFGGDGVANGSSMTWSWDVEGNQSLTAQVRPDYEGNTTCSAEEFPVFSAVEADNGCANPIPVRVGDGPRSCTIVNTVFLEGIPTLGDAGKLLFALLMLITGLVFIRRI
ncbi:hypothetical protein [Elongatibacter sediminis]|uniref:Ig-like domain-containing protein n=1 Tax=Elongatibacter sediminis TaxID=3119006 RepID=A0AAW9RCE0_9GAMM